MVVVPDLGYGGCRRVVAGVPESWIDVTHMIDLVDLTSEFKDAGKYDFLPDLDQVPRLDPGLLPQVGHLLLRIDDRLSTASARAAPEPGNRPTSSSTWTSRGRP